MSTTNQTAIPSEPSTFSSIFDAALEEYKSKTGQDLRTHSFANLLGSCNSESADAILTIFQNQVDAHNRSKKNCHTLLRCLNTIVPILLMFSDTLGGGLSLVCLDARFLSLLSILRVTHYQAFPPAKVIFSGVGVLLQVKCLP
jgi:hypothetical protein